MTAQWTPTPPWDAGQPCQHCPERIWQVGNTGLWEDALGITVCVKLQPGHSGYVHHQPMPPTVDADTAALPGSP